MAVKREQRGKRMAELERAYEELRSSVKRLESSENRLAALSAISSLITQTLEVEQVLNSAIEKIAEVMNIEVALIFLVNRETNELELLAHRGVSQEFVAAMEGMKVGEGFNGGVASSGEAIVVEDASHDPRLSREEVCREGLYAQLIVPLKCEGRIIGTLCLAVRQARQFQPEDIELLTTAGNAICVALENARLYEEQRRIAENVRFHVQQVVRAQEEERKRIARELHADTAQLLGSLSREVDNFVRKKTGLLPDEVAFLQYLRQQLNRGLQAVHRFSQNLRPPILDDLGLLPALRSLASEMKEYDRIDVELRVLGSERRFTPEVELLTFRIVQDALSNVRRHAEASRAWVVMEFAEGKTRLTISDNGQGFELPGRVDDLPRSGKLGLAGIQERARLFGGTLELQSTPGKGTTLIVEIPN